MNLDKLSNKINGNHLNCNFYMILFTTVCKAKPESVECRRLSLYRI